MKLKQAEVEFIKNNKYIGSLILKYTMEMELREQINAIQKIIDSDNFSVYERKNCIRP